MKERPILFQSDMVRALLDGRKTQTRRIVKPQLRSLGVCTAEDLQRQLGIGRDPAINKTGWLTVIDTNGMRQCLNAKAHGVPGDRLWVREAFATMCRLADPYCPCEYDDERDANHYYEYKADTNNRYPGGWDGSEDAEQGADYVPRWRPSIHMPRAACRITLEVTSVRVERLQEITEADAIAEGIEKRTATKGRIFWRDYLNETDLDILGGQRWYSNPRQSFRSLINSINGIDTWDSNPWVWVMGFRVCK